jgi:hypothetical protein
MTLTYVRKVIVIDANKTVIERHKKAISAVLLVKRAYIHSNTDVFVFLSDILKNASSP